MTSRTDEERIQRRIAERRQYYGKNYDYYNRAEKIEKRIRKANGDFSVKGCTDESGKSLDGGCDRF